MRSLAHRVVSSVVLGLGFVLQVLAALPAAPATVKLPDSTPVKLVSLDRMSSAINQIDDIIHFEVAEDVRLRGSVIILKGALASGHVVEVQRRGRKDRSGKLDFTLDYVKAVDGSNLHVRVAPPRHDKDRRSLVPDPFRLIERGKDVEIPQGARFVAYVDGDHEISLDNVSSAEASRGGAPRSAASGMNELSVVTFTSTPDHADITVDGKFLGTTPSTVRLVSGDHSVTIEKLGFKTWQRIMTVGVGGDVSLDVTLEKTP
jgi:hypothetical protein